MDKIKSSRYLITASLLCAQATFGQSPTLEEVMVTATKRTVSVMDTPLSMETVSGEELLSDNIADLEDLVAQMPNVHISNGAQTNRIAIRGVAPGNDRSFEQSVAMFIDGIYMPRSRQYRAPFFDMERIEVLRGPQAVLYGLNATAGTILIHSNTTRAGQESEGSVTAGYETEFNGYFAEVVGGTSIGDSLGVRLAARFVDTGDGYWENAITGEDENTAEDTNVRLSLDWAVTDTWSITTKIHYTNADEFGNYGEQVYSDDTPPFTAAAAEASGFITDPAFDWVRYTDNVFTDILGEDVGIDHDILNVSINSEWQFGEHTLTALLSYSESNYDQVYNVDASATYADNLTGLETDELLGQVLGTLIDEDYEQTALELRFTSPENQTLSYILGLYMDTNDLSNYNDSVAGMLLGGVEAGGLAIRGQSEQVTESDMISPYVTVTWNASERLQVTGGVRYTYQTKDHYRKNYNCYNLLNEKIAPASAFGQEPGPGGWYVSEDITGSGASNCGTFPGLEDDRTSENIMPELIVQYDLSDDSVLYGKIGESAKAGGFVMSNTLALAEDVEYDDEEALGYEIGYKARLMDQRLELNVALFRNEFTDLQVSSFNTPPGSAPVLTISNAGESTSQGLELELNYAATDWLVLGTSLAWLDSEYDKYEGAGCSLPETAAGMEECDKSGESTPFAPDYSGSVFADLSVPMGANLLLNGGVRMSFSDSYFTEPALNPSAEQDAYETWDARIGIADADNKWNLSVIGRNLTEEEVNGMGVPFVGMIGYIGAPRTIMVQGTYNF